MDPRDLAYFEVIAETGHLGRAAQRLGRTQPALTKCIHRLESSVGAQLFARAGRGIALTAVGEILLGYARQIRSTMEASLREVRAFASGEAGHVRIGTGPTMAEYLLPQVCSALIAAAPDITMGIFIGMDAVLRASLRSGGLDILVSPVLAGEEHEFAIDAFGQDEVVVVAAHGHPLCGRPVTIHDLSPFRWVLPDRSVGLRQWLDTVFKANGILGPLVQIETNSIVLLPRLIVETELLSFTSTRNLSPGRMGRYVERLGIDTTTLRRQFGVVQRRDVFPSPAVSRVARFLVESGQFLRQ